MSLSQLRSLASWALVSTLSLSAAVAQAPQSPESPAPTADAPADKSSEAPAPKSGGGAESAAPDLARSAIDELRRLEKGLKGKRGASRVVALHSIAKRGEVLASSLNNTNADADSRARVWFLVGDAWRRHGSAEPAAIAYGKSVAQDSDRYLQRAVYQLGQMQRRLGETKAALASYRKAASVQVRNNRAHDARVWVARCLDLQGEADPALAAYRAAVKEAATPRQCIDGSNWLAKALLQRGDLKGAQAALAHAEDVVAKAGGGQKERAALAKALSKMSARRALRKALDTATDAASDAVDVEASSGGKPDPDGSV